REEVPYRWGEAGGRERSCPCGCWDGSEGTRSHRRESNRYSSAVVRSRERQDLPRVSSSALRSLGSALQDRGGAARTASSSRGALRRRSERSACPNRWNA